ncbi:HNH endonuclease signature motif containing protein, partial [Spirillospora sp. NPDC048911]|uniref:HNH endonuclease signature motif containing protein n=1 Tax=Spirillospora sp. NPDC048911 TaxID=3364527 RepID=UPI00371B9CF1
VLETLYDTCAVRGCEVPGLLCEIDHVDGWALGNSPTDIDKLALCCGWHNRWKHANPEQIEISQGEDGRFVYRTLPPKGKAARSRRRLVDQADNPWRNDHHAA